MAALRIGTARAVRRDRPAADEASRARGGIGTAGPVPPRHGRSGSWPSLVAGLPGFRSLVLDRPGWGLSTPVEFPRSGYRAFVADLLAASLDALDIDRIDVVGGSIGDLWALSLAEHHPDRVGRDRPPGCRSARPGGPGPAVHPGRVLADRSDHRSPARQPGPRPLDPARQRARTEPGRRPDPGRRSSSGAWQTTPRRSRCDTNERWCDGSSTARPIGPGSSSRRRAPADRCARAVRLRDRRPRPATPDIWRAFTTSLPNGSLELIDGAGNMPWFDDPGRVAALVGTFLARPSIEAMPPDAGSASATRQPAPAARS